MEINNIVRFSNFYSINEYTRAAAVSPNTCRNRIKSRLIAAIEIDKHWFVDIKLSPPGVSYPPNKKRAKMFASLPGGIKAADLRHVKMFAHNKKYRADRFLQAILNGEIRVWW